jgi:hypothetical protein
LVWFKKKAQSMEQADRLARIRRRLRIVRYVGAADLVLLVALVTSSWSGNRELVGILGPLHGGTFLLLLTLTITAAADGYWSWWFPIGIALTGGPIGALVGEWLVARRLAAHAVVASHAAAPIESPINTTIDPSRDEADAIAPQPHGQVADVPQERSL